MAQTPPEHRSASRLLYQRHPRQPLSDHYVTDLPELLPSGALLVLNNSGVFPGRLSGRLPGGGKAEILLLRKPSGTGAQIQAPALGRPLRKLRPGTCITFADSCQGTILQQQCSSGQGSVVIGFDLSEHEFDLWLHRAGEIPLPPYIRREQPQRADESPDRERYQTVYAGPEGSAAAPTAGLHLDQELLTKLAAKDIRTAEVTLHVGGGTFLPVRQQDLAQHRMHTECYQVPQQSVAAMLQAQEEGRPVIAVGTTSFRAVESLFPEARKRGLSVSELAGTWQETSLFVRPEFRESRYHSEIFTGIMTNFHQPETTLFMLICALLGFERAQQAYRHAIGEGYRLFSYGDSGLFLF